MNKGILYLVATPIGNLEDITFRAIKILNEVDIIAAEDTRQTLKLLNYYKISKKLVSYHRHSEDKKLEFLISKLKEGNNIAVVSDAGTPAISDPGQDIVQSAIKENIKIIPIPGACALINALIISGLDTKEFSFYGFLPLNKKLRLEKLEQIKNEEKTSIIYESPHRLQMTCKDIKKNIGDRYIVIVKELTKIHEKTYRGNISEIINQIEEEPKGEFILLIKGEKLNKENKLNKLSLEEHYEYYKKQGFEKKEIIKKIAKDRETNKNEIYQKFI